MIQDSSVKQTLIRDSISKTGLDVAVFSLLALPHLSSRVGRREKMCQLYEFCIELVSKELNHLAAILHAYAGGLNFMK